MFKSVLVAASASLMLLGAPAAADSGSSTTISVEYADLNLSTPEGQKQLERRLNAAASKVCRVRDQRTGTRIISPAATQCFAKARANAQAQMAALIDETKLGG